MSGEATGRSSPARRSSDSESGQALKIREEGCGVGVGRKEQRRERRRKEGRKKEGGRAEGSEKAPSAKGAVGQTAHWVVLGQGSGSQ